MKKNYAITIAFLFFWLSACGVTPGQEETIITNKTITDFEAQTEAPSHSSTPNAATEPSQSTHQPLHRGALPDTGAYSDPFTLARGRRIS